MAHPAGILTWTPGSAAVITDLWANADDDATTAANWNVYHGAFDSQELGGVEYQTCNLYDVNDNIVLFFRTRSGGVFGAWRPFVMNGTGRFALSRGGSDNHDVIAFGMDSDGIGHISHDMHAQALKYRRTTLAINDRTDTLNVQSTNQAMVGTNETSVTYPCFVRCPATGKLYYFFRDGGSGAGDLYMYVYDTTGDTWSAAPGTGTGGIVVSGNTSSPAESPYWNFPAMVFTPDWDGAGTGFAYISWQWREGDGEEDTHDTSVVRWDGTTFDKTTNASQTIPATHENCEIVNAFAKQLATSFGAHCVDSNGELHMFVGYDDGGGDSQLWHTRKVTGTWTTTSTGISTSGSTQDWTGSTVRAVCDLADDTIHLITTMPNDVDNGVYAFSSDGSDYSSWTMTTLTSRDTSTLRNHRSDIAPIIDDYQWRENGVITMLVPLSADGDDTFDPADYAGYLEATSDAPAGALTDNLLQIGIDSTFTDFWANVASDGKDIRVTLDDDTRVAADVIFDYANERCWITTPYTGSTGATRRVYCGYASAVAPDPGSQYGRYNAYPDRWREMHAWATENRTKYRNDLDITGGSPTWGGEAGPATGSRATDLNGTSQYGLAYANPPGSAPLWVMAWVNPDVTNVDMMVWSQTATNTTNVYTNLTLGGTLASPITDPVRWWTRSGGTIGNSYSSSSFTSGAWQHICGGDTATNNRQGGIGGALGTAATDTVAPNFASTGTRTEIGALTQSSGTIQYYNGKVALVKVSTTAITANEAAWDAAQGDQATFWNGWTWNEGAPSAPVNSVAPAVTGTEATGKTLSCTSGTWSGSPTYAYQWYTNGSASTSGGTAIGGATSSTFVLTDSQDDLYVYCVVTATNIAGSDSEPSNVVGPILGLNVIVKNNPVFADVADFDQETIFNEAIGDDGTGEEMPAPTTWNTDSPVGDIDWSAFTLAVDANAINRSNRAGATLISPNYCVIAQHAPGDNTGHTWMTPAGAEVTRTLGETLDTDYWEFSGSDLALCKLSAPINNITPMPMILDSSKVAGRGCLVLEMDRHLNTYVIPESLDNTDASVSVYQDPGTDYIESGDSGKPVTIIINDTAVMVMTAMFASSIDGSRYIGLGPNASHFIDEIFAITAEDGESPTVWDLQIGSASSGITFSAGVPVTFSPSSAPLAI